MPHAFVIHRRGFVATIVVLMIGSIAIRPAAAAPDTIPFQPIEQAIATARQQHKVIAVFFTAEWCGWCKRMAADTFADPQVLAEASHFAWVKVDIDDQPEFAAQFGVRGVPAVAWFNASGEFLEMSAGYLPAETMRAKLADLKDKADQHSKGMQLMMAMVKSADELIATKDPAKRAAMVQQIVHNASAAALERRELAERIIKQAGPAAWPGLVQCMASDKLAERAAAYDLLCDSTGQTLAFDPFADGGTRTKQLAAWKNWLAAQPAAPSTAPDHP